MLFRLYHKKPLGAFEYIYTHQYSPPCTDCLNHRHHVEYTVIRVEMYTA
jgi:hypothetical protein